MRQIRIAKRRRGQASWRQAPLPPDPRDPRDIVHAHRAARCSGRSDASRPQPAGRAGTEPIPATGNA